MDLSIDLILQMLLQDVPTQFLYIRYELIAQLVYVSAIINVIYLFKIHDRKYILTQFYIIFFLIACHYSCIYITVITLKTINTY